MISALMFLKNVLADTNLFLAHKDISYLFETAHLQ